MSLEIKVPAFPESVTDGVLVNWHKKVGDLVERDDVLAEIETDKVVFEVPAMESGVITDILAVEGAVVTSGQLIAKMNAQTTASEAKQQKQASIETPETKREEEVSDSNVTVLHGKKEQQEKIVSPAAKKWIAENKIDVADIQGTGKGNRVLKQDVIRAIDNQKIAQSAIMSQTQVGNRKDRRVPMSRLRARIAERLVESQQNAAILTTFNEVNMQPVMDLRKRHGESFEKQHGVRLGFMSFFVRAVVEALKRFPDVNASVEDKDIVYHEYFDIGIAVGSPRGLVVPVLRDADQLGFAGIEKAILGFGQRANEGSLTLEEITGGTFSISNGGVFGSMLSTPIINPPQSAILGLHKIEKRPVVIDDQVVIRPVMYLALSYDHRLIDGRGAVQFLVTVKTLIEDPSRLLLEI